ncbi:hypothetical protein D3C81_1206120 [compost metagenome]
MGLQPSVQLDLPLIKHRLWQMLGDLRTFEQGLVDHPFAREPSGQVDEGMLGGQPLEQAMLAQLLFAVMG